MNEENYIFILTISLFIGFLYFLINAYLALSPMKIPPRGKYSLKDVTAVIPVYNEDLKLFEEVIKSISHVKFIVVGDGCLEPYYSITKKYDGIFIYLKERSGKRRAIAEGVKRVETPLVLLLDSDTILPKESLLHMVSLMDERTGGISPRILMINNGKSSYYYAEFFERMSEILQRALSRFGKAAVLYGHCALYKTELVRKLVLSKDFIEPKILGRRILIGDDRQLTNFILSNGYRAFIDYDAVAYTAPPENIKKFTNQVIRWTKSNYLYFLEDVVRGTLLKKGALYAFNAVYTNLLPFVFLIISFVSLIENPKILSLHSILVYPMIFIGFVLKILHYLIFLSGFLGLFIVPPPVPHHAIDPTSIKHLSYLEKSVHIATTLSSFPFVITLLRLVERNKLKVLIIGSVAVAVQAFAAFYSIFTLFVQDGWRTR